jgi:branched-chain amino acid transport system permease protein
MLALEFHSNLIGPTLILGIAAAGLYGLLAVPLVLTYRVSRTIGFVQGGIAVFATFLYWYLTYDAGALSGFAGADTRMGRVSGLLFVVGLGAVFGLVYGITVTGKRLANWPHLNLTIYSLGFLLLLVATALTKINPQEARLPSVFGTRTFRVFNSVVTIHQVATIVFLIGIIAVLGFVMMRTQAGINIRAIADDIEASRFVGVPINRVGIGVYAFAGALSALAGVLLASTAGVALPNLLAVFLRALTVSILGGFTSFSLALAGCLLLGIGESALTAGTFGPISGGAREVVIMATLFGLVLLINKFRPTKVLEAQGL